MNEPELSVALKALKEAKSILLIDWPDMDVPRKLLDAGFTVYSYSPDNYSRAMRDDAGNTIRFEPLEGHPGSVDIVNVFRPEQELPGIAEKHVLPLKARVLWLHPPVTSAWAADFAAEHSLLFITGVNIAELASQLKQ